MLFLLSPRVIDFDTYLPTAMEMKRLRPQWRVQFVTFSQKNYDFIRRNPTLMAGLRHCGELHLLGGRTGTGLITRVSRRIVAMARLAGWICRYPQPILFLARPYTEFPYSLVYFLARLRGGMGLLLSKTCSPEEVYRFTRAGRGESKPITKSLLSSLMRRDLDGVIHYHARQQGAIDEIAIYGRIHDVPWRRIGLPHMLPAWKQLIAAEVSKERARLAAQGIAADAEIYCIFAPKSWSAVHLRSRTSVADTFLQVLRALFRLRPNAVLLVRPHPLAQDEPYLKDAEAEFGPQRFIRTFAHPEVMISLARRTLYINPTTIMFGCFPGKQIDVSDYPARHYKEFGERSLADGLGVIFVNPRASDFDTAFAQALNDDTLFDDKEITRGVSAILDEGPADLSVLLRWVESGAPPPDERRTATC